MRFIPSGTGQGMLSQRFFDGKGNGKPPKRIAGVNPLSFFGFPVAILLCRSAFHSPDPFAQNGCF